MDKSLNELPDGFILENGLPEGFVLESSLPQYKKMSFKEAWNATPEELNENVKALGRQRLKDRRKWEENHPIISEIQKAYQPNYRADLIDMKNQAQYGMKTPWGEMARGEIQKIGQNFVPATNLAVTAVTAGTGTAKGLLPAIAQGAKQGAIQGGVEGLTAGIADNGLSAQSLAQGVQSGIIGGTTGGALPALKPVQKWIAKTPFGQFNERVSNGMWQGLLESYGMGKEAIDRLIKSPRGTTLSKNANYYGSEDFVNSVANRFNTGVNKFRNQEIEAFANAKNKLIENNQDTRVDLSGFVDETLEKLKERGLINELGEITPIGNKAVGLQTFLDDLNAYKGSFDVDDVQRLKTDILDDIIDYRPEAGKKLNNATRGLQGIVKGSRKDINNKLASKLGMDYEVANTRLSNVLNMLDDVPEIKDLTNATNIDTLATKLKKIGTTRQEAQRKLQDLESVMNNNGVSVSDTTIVDDILDYNAAKNIKERIRTGQDAGLRNIPRRALIQPMTEFYIDRIVPILPILQQTPKVLPSVLSTISRPLQGRVEYNERY